MTIKDLLANSEVEMNGSSRITLRFATAQVIVLIMTLSSLATSVIFAVWLTTRDLKGEVSSLAAAVNELRQVLADQDDRLGDVELEQKVVTEIQRRVLKTLGYIKDPAVRERLTEQAE